MYFAKLMHLISILLPRSLPEFSTTDKILLAELFSIKIWNYLFCEYLKVAVVIHRWENVFILNQNASTRFHMYRFSP